MYLWVFVNLLGCYLGITSAAFAAGTTSWFNLLHLSAINPDAYSICKEAAFSSCATLTIWDFIVADNHILFLTSKGVVRSEDIAKVAQTKTVLNSNKVSYMFSVLVLAFDAAVERKKVMFQFK